MATSDLDVAVEQLRALEWRAAEGWPMGFDATQIRAELAAIYAVLDRAERAVPERARPEWARALRERIERRHFAVTVQPRRRLSA